MADNKKQIRGIPLPPWTVGDIIKAALLCLVLIGVALVAIVIAGLALRSPDWSIGGNAPLVVVTLVVVQNVAFILSVWLFGPRKHHVGMDALGLRPFVASAGCGMTVVALVVALGFNVLYSLMLGGLGHSINEQQVLPLFGGGLLGFGVALVLVSLVAPFVEEILFRGFLFPGLARRFGFVAGLLLSAVLFGAAHGSVDSFVPLAFFGLVLGLLYNATGSIYPGIVMHSLNNSIALLAAYLVEMGVMPR